jgi:hypothetical protein
MEDSWFAMSDTHFFPDFITALAGPDSPIVQLDGWLVKGDHPLVMFYEVHDTGIEVGEHSHGAQWGVVLQGKCEFTIGGETAVYERGDTYVIPEGVPHRAIIHSGYVGIDVFADHDRYATKTQE